MKEQCRSEIDRNNRCYRCGEVGHKAQTCLAPPKCPVCSDLGRPSNHRAGNKACFSAQVRNRTRLTTTVGQITSTNHDQHTQETGINIEPPKEQRAARIVLKNVRSEEMAIGAEPETQEQRDRENRLIKTRNKKKGETRRGSEEEDNADNECEPEDSRHGKKQQRR